MPNNDSAKFEKNWMIFRGSRWPLKFCASRAQCILVKMTVSRLLNMLEGQVMA